MATSLNRVFISAGEASGDAYGAALVREFKRRENQMQIEGIGSVRMRAEGVQLHADSSRWGAISIVQGIRVGFGVLPHYWHAKKLLRIGPPGLFIPIDFGFMNISLARHAKKHGWKVLYFVPPGSWRRDRQGKDLPLITDAIATPFEWSAKILNEMGANAHWFGHPIKQLIAEAEAKNPLLEGERQGIAVLPGSRKHELEMTLPLIAGAVKVMKGGWSGSNLPGVSQEVLRLSQANLADRLEFALAPSLDAEKIKTWWEKLAPGRSDVFTVGDAYGVLRRGKVGIVCSGTATLEAAICGCPMVVIYQLSPAMRREAKLLRIKQPRFVSLPNIISDREIVPELVDGRGVHPTELRMWLDKLLTDDTAREAQREELHRLDNLLGPSDAIAKTAELAVQMMAEKSS